MPNIDSESLVSAGACVEGDVTIENSIIGSDVVLSGVESPIVVKNSRLKGSMVLRDGPVIGSSQIQSSNKNDIFQFTGNVIIENSLIEGSHWFSEKTLIKNSTVRGKTNTQNVEIENLNIDAQQAFFKNCKMSYGRIEGRSIQVKGGCTVTGSRDRFFIGDHSRIDSDGFFKDILLESGSIRDRGFMDQILEKSVDFCDRFIYQPLGLIDE